MHHGEDLQWVPGRLQLYLIPNLFIEAPLKILLSSKNDLGATTARTLVLTFDKRGLTKVRPGRGSAKRKAGGVLPRPRGWRSLTRAKKNGRPTWMFTDGLAARPDRTAEEATRTGGGQGNLVRRACPLRPLHFELQPAGPPHE